MRRVEASRPRCTSCLHVFPCKDCGCLDCTQSLVLFSSTVSERLERARGPRGRLPRSLESRARSRISLAQVSQLLMRKERDCVQSSGCPLWVHNILTMWWRGTLEFTPRKTIVNLSSWPLSRSNFPLPSPHLPLFPSPPLTSHSSPPLPSPPTLPLPRTFRVFSLWSPASCYILLFQDHWFILLVLGSTWCPWWQWARGATGR